jgi:mannose-6-phosphate isomerase-like protein (cupin superfamily)
MDECRRWPRGIGMRKRSLLWLAFLLIAPPVWGQPAPLAQRIGHYVPITTPPPPRPPGQPGPHQGAGALSLANLLDAKNLSGNWTFFQRGVLWPHSSIGEHFHLGTEEMFVILDGDAQFTIDGRTAMVKGPAAVPVRLTHGHAVYNPTGKPMQWMNISVSARNGGGIFENGDARAGGDPLDRIPQFLFARMDRAQLQPVPKMDGGTGTVMARRLFGPGAFSTLWSYTDHLLLTAGTSIGRTAKPDISEIYYVLAGAGTVTVDGQTVAIKAGDAIPVDFGQNRAFAQTGSEPLELFVNAVARNQAVKDAIVDPYPPAPKISAGR